MKNTIIRFFVSAVAILLCAKFLPGISVKGGILSALWIAVVFSIVNTFIKPVFTLFTLPLTIVSLGLFLFVINGIMVYLTGLFVSSFQVSGIISALIFSVVYTVVMSILESIFGLNQKED